MKRAIIILAVFGMLICTYYAQAAIVADSQASFNGVQGESNWNWMVWDGAGTYTTSSASYCPIWADWVPAWYNSDWFGIHVYGFMNQVGYSGGHDNWAITRWTSTVAAPVKISMKLGVNGDDKAKSHLWINGNQMWSKIIQSGEADIYNYFTILNVGDIVDFGNDAQGTALSTLTSAKYRIETLPEPETTLVADSKVSFGSQNASTGPQGNDGWYWMYWNGVGNYTTASAVKCPNWAVGVGYYNSDWFGIHIYGYMNQIGYSGGYNNWAITRWKSSVSGAVKISMSLGVNGNDQARSYLWINGNQKWSKVIPTGSPGTYDYYTFLNIGDLVDFCNDSQGAALSTLTTVQYRIYKLPDVVTLTGKVALGDFTGDITEVPVNVDLNGVSHNINLDSTGNFSINNIPEGSYNVLIKASHWLSKTINIESSTDIRSFDGIVNIKSGMLDINLNQKTGQPPVGGLKITEGVGGSRVNFSEPSDWNITNKSAEYSIKETGGDIDLKVGYKTSDSVLINLEFTNNGNRQRLLEVCYSLFESGNDLKWWDGLMESEPGIDEMSYERMLLRLPMSVVYSNIRGTAIGLDPHFVSSMFAAGADKVDGGLMVNFRTRIVLDPGQKLTLPIYVFSFTQKYEYLDAVQRLYDMYPDMFSIVSGMRPIMVGAGGYLFSGKAARHLQSEETRRLGMGWEWSYCPAQRPGDWYPDERFWDDQVGYAGDVDAHQNLVPGSLEDFRNAMRERFHGGWPTAALAYYMLPIASEEAFLKSMDGGILVDQNGSPSPPQVGWIKGNWTTYMAYPWNNGYGNEVIKAIDNIAEDFQPSMIAFDEANRMDKHYGKGIEGESGRAWDVTGVFSSVQVALARLADNIHSHNVKGYTLGQAMNKPWTYNTATRSDVAMHEWVPWENLGSAKSMRLLLGNKPMSWWQDLDMSTVLEWESMTPEEIREGIYGIEDYVRLISFRYGAMPANFQLKGAKGLTDMMPSLIELCKEGWQAVPAAKGNSDLWLARYGKGVKTFIFAGNPKQNSRSASIQIDTDYLGKGHFLFSDYTGNPLTTVSSNGVSQIDMGNLGKHEQIIARALVQIVTSDNSNNTGSSSFTWEPLNEGKVEASWVKNQSDSSINDSLIIRLPFGASAEKLTINGKDYQYTVLDGMVEYKGKLPDNCTMVLTYKPLASINTQISSLLSFPFVLDDKANSSIRLPLYAGETDRLSAQRISSYFEWYYHRQSSPNGILWDLPKSGQTVSLPVIEHAQSSSMSYEVELKQSNESASISLSVDSKHLIISGKTPGERDAAVLRLLSILDKKYPFYITLPNTPIYIKAELAGKTLP